MSVTTKRQRPRTAILSVHVEVDDRRRAAEVLRLERVLRRNHFPFVRSSTVRNASLEQADRFYHTSPHIEEIL